MNLSRLLTYCFLLLVNFPAISETPGLPNHDIVVFDLLQTQGEFQLANPIVIAGSPGYDNQPYFSADAKSVYFTRIEDNNADIWMWSQRGNNARKLVASELSEYSPTPLPFDKQSLSTVRVEEDGTQRLWKYSLQSGFSKIFESIKPVGYHVWHNKNIALYVLGEPAQLQVTRLGEEKSKVIDLNIGRCLQKIPGGSHVSYTVIEDGIHRLKTFDFADGMIKKLQLLPKNSQDYVWLNRDTVISSNGSSLLIANTRQFKDWKTILNKSKFKLSGITRLALSPDGKKIAVVFINT